MIWYHILATLPNGKTKYYCGDGGTKTSYRKTRDPYTLRTITRRVYIKPDFSEVYCSFMSKGAAELTIKRLIKRQEKNGEHKGYTFAIVDLDPEMAAHFCALCSPIISGATVHIKKDFREYDCR